MGATRTAAKDVDGARLNVPAAVFLSDMTKMSAQIALWAACRAELNAVLVASIGWRAQTNELSLSRSLSTGSLEPVSFRHRPAAVSVRRRQAVQVSGASLLRKHPADHLRSRYA